MIYRRWDEAIPLYPALHKPKLRALTEFARNVLTWATCFEYKTVFRFAFLRSDLFCHHMKSTLATYQFLLCEAQLTRGTLHEVFEAERQLKRFLMGTGHSPIP
ncbi:hypothetical protein SAMN05192563_102426 [Paraburkholderia aspalathi]|uniref:Uncharacterized protein n=1 Tax=Paraburkholderia aspalathi TaxID=1324617 RepID=A0A1I7EJ70_9BURK|nr:hypothetical protein SAMN05192563_102426 [Paraburkholderia aspalathi]